MRNYIGLDAHSATSTFVVVNSEGVELDRCQVLTTEKNLLSYVNSFKGKKSLAFEESNLSKWLWCVLENEVDDLIVCNPVYLSRKQGAKDDYPDAKHLAQELRCNNLVPVFHEDNEFMDMRALVGAYSDLVTDIVRAKNRYKALFRSEGLNTKGKTMYKKPERIKELSGLNQFVAENLIQQIIFLGERKELFTKELGGLSKKHKDIRNLDTIPGIDIIRASFIVALICSPHRFRDKHKLWAYSMLIKYTEKSDGRNYGKRMIHGRGELKNAFLGAAESILKGQSGLRKYYDSLRSRGLDHRKAKVALARRVAAISLSLLRNDTVYKDKHEEVEKRVKNKIN